MPQNFCSSPLKTWLLENTKNNTKNKLNFPWNSIFLYTIRAIWLERNNWLFINEHKTPSLPSKIALANAVEFLSNLDCIFRTDNHTNLSLWKTPQPSWLKLNTDGSLSSSVVGSCGCLRDEICSWLLGFSGYLGYGNALLSELWAIWHGLHLAIQRYPNSKILLETDSSEAIHLLTKNNTITHPLDCLIKNCKLLLTKLTDYQVIKASRKMLIVT